MAQEIDRTPEAPSESLVYAQDSGGVIAAVVDTMSAIGGVAPRAWLGIVGRNAKVLIEDGFPFDMVVAASLMAIRRGSPHVVQHIAGDLMLAQTGGRMSRRDYEVSLQLHTQKQEKPDMLAEHRAKREKRRAS